jgi:hypothetical protein
MTGLGIVLALTAVLATWITALVHSDNSRWDALHCRATTARWGIGPVGAGHWRGTLGISIVIAGHGYALFRWPKEGFAAGDRSGPKSRA